MMPPHGIVVQYRMHLYQNVPPIQFVISWTLAHATSNFLRTKLNAAISCMQSGETQSHLLSFLWSNSTKIEWNGKRPEKWNIAGCVGLAYPTHFEIIHSPSCKGHTSQQHPDCLMLEHAHRIKLFRPRIRYLDAIHRFYLRFSSYFLAAISSNDTDLVRRVPVIAR